MQFIEVAKGLYLEALCTDNDAVLFGDVVGGGIHRVADNGQASDWLTGTRWIAAMLLNDDGSIIYSGSWGIAWFNPKTSRSGVLLDAIDGKAVLGVNEMTPDRQGGMYFGTIDLQSIMRGEKPRPSVLYHLSADRHVTKLRDGLTFSNGLTLSLDGKRFYHNESFVGVFAYPVLADGTFGDRVMLAPRTDCDGMVLDAAGNVWISGFDSNELLCLEDNGAIKDKIQLPSHAATNLRFGGRELDRLYINTIPEGVATKLAIGELPAEPSSILYYGQSSVRGFAIPRTGFRLD